MSLNFDQNNISQEQNARIYEITIKTMIFHGLTSYGIMGDRQGLIGGNQYTTKGCVSCIPTGTYQHYTNIGFNICVITNIASQWFKFVMFTTRLPTTNWIQWAIILWSFRKIVYNNETYSIWKVYWGPIIIFHQHIKNIMLLL